MAFLEMNFHSDTLKMGVSVNVILPETAKTAIGIDSKTEQSYKTILLLHGLSDDHTIWHRRTSIERYATERGIAVVMPAADKSWYTDEAGKYLTFIGEELPRVCRSFFKGMSDKAEDTFLVGNSMGGYGSVKIALLYPETFGGAGSLSGAFAIDEFSKVCKGYEWQTVFGRDFESPDCLMGSRHDVFKIASDYRESKKPFPKLYLWCGNNDFFTASNRKFSEHLKKLGFEHLFEDTDGDHSWGCWDLFVRHALDYLLK